MADPTRAGSDREQLAAFLLAMRSRLGADGRMLSALETVPRRAFLPPATRGDVYAPQSFPIPCGETMPSAELIVRCLMALKVQPDSRILEIGTGSGYVTALLARLGARVVTLERFRTLSAEASERVRGLGIENVTFHHEDGRQGFAESGPYDRIIIHAALPVLPKAFLDQMATHGVLLAAIGPERGAQRLVRHEKAGSRFDEAVVGTVWWQHLAAGRAAVL